MIKVTVIALNHTVPTEETINIKKYAPNGFYFYFNTTRKEYRIDS
jgi:hypothetical protein